MSALPLHAWQLMGDFFCMSRRVPVFNVGCNGLTHVHQMRLQRNCDDTLLSMDMESLDKDELRR